MGFAYRASDVRGTERVILVLDRSVSMDEKDWTPSRLAGAIEASEALIDLKTQQYPADEVGVVAFASQAKVIHKPARLALGAKSIKRCLRRLGTAWATNITAGLKLAEDLLYGRTGGKEVKGWLSRLLYDQQSVAQKPAAVKTANRVILLTDGEHNDGAKPYRIASKLKARGTIIDCIGIGGGPGSVDEGMLKKIASIDADGTPRYCFIGDKQKLIRKFKKLAVHIRPA